MDRTIDVKELKGITQDSRKVEAGYLFAAIPGVKSDGRAYINEAIQKGATHILAPVGTELPSNDNVIFVTDKNPRKKLAEIAAAFYKKQPEYIAAVTGTNGKTSTVTFARQLWEMDNKKAVSVGTIGIHGAGLDKIATMTTPDAITLHKELAELTEKGITHLAIEASSHGLDQYRLDGMHVNAAGFTNLSRDHLDYHPDMKSYLDAKTRLFTQILDKKGVAVLNADVPEFKSLKKTSDHIISYGFKGEELQILDLKPTAHGQNLKLKVYDEEMDIKFPLVGQFQVMNALCALGLAAANKKDMKRMAKNLADLKGVPGRLQRVNYKKAGIYVDYAHTPDALENILKSLRPHTENKLICVFGCGGDRDKGKRPAMGKIASDLADQIIVTDDNPRSEDPAQIRADILAGIKSANVQEISGRREAIQTAIKNLQAGDVLVIAGKGHEQGQIFKDHVEEFDDVREAKISIQKMESEKCS